VDRHLGCVADALAALSRAELTPTQRFSKDRDSMQLLTGSGKSKAIAWFPAFRLFQPRGDAPDQYGFGCKMGWRPLIHPKRGS